MKQAAAASVLVYEKQIVDAERNYKLCIFVYTHMCSVDGLDFCSSVSITVGHFVYYFAHQPFAEIKFHHSLVFFYYFASSIHSLRTCSMHRRVFVGLFMFVCACVCVRGAKLQIIGLEISYSHCQIELINSNALHFACGCKMGNKSMYTNGVHFTWIHFMVLYLFLSGPPSPFVCLFVYSFLF